MAEPDTNAIRLAALRRELDRGVSLVEAIAAVNAHFRAQAEEVNKDIAEYVQIVKSGEPYSAQDVQLLCLKCPLADCDEESAMCLIRIARRRDPRINSYIQYQNWLASGDEERLSRRERLKREAAARRRERGKAEVTK